MSSSRPSSSSPPLGWRLSSPLIAPFIRFILAATSAGQLVQLDERFLIHAGRRSGRPPENVRDFPSFVCAVITKKAKKKAVLSIALAKTAERLAKSLSH